MKIRLLFLVLMISGSLSAQINKKLVKERSKQNTLTVPPMGIWLHDNLFIDETEIANIHWLEFEYYAKDSALAFYDKIQPYMEEIEWSISDTIIDSLPTPTTHPEYLRYPGFRYFPVVGITYEQAIQYCEWRSVIVTDAYNQMLAEKKSNKRVYIHYRLPTEKEWEMAARGFDSTADAQTGLPHSMMPKEKKDTFSRTNYNCNVPFSYHYVHSTAAMVSVNTDYIYDYSSNAIGLYNLIGNVSEMIDQEGVAKGGNWRMPPDSCYITSRQYYDCPNTWTGFRCVAEVYEYKAGASHEIIAPLQPKANHCSWITDRNHRDEYLRNENNPEFITRRLLSFTANYDKPGKAKLFYYGMECPANEIIPLNNSVLQFTIKDIPTPDSIEVLICSMGYQSLLMRQSMTYVNVNQFTHQLNYDVEHPERNINGLIVKVYYKKNETLIEETLYRVIK